MGELAVDATARRADEGVEVGDYPLRKLPREVRQRQIQGEGGTDRQTDRDRQSDRHATGRTRGETPLPDGTRKSLF